MKSAIGVLLFLIVAVPLVSQDVPPEERATLLSVGGEIPLPVGINGQAVGWTLTRTHYRVDIAAHLGNGGGHAYVDAYLMHAIGPGTTEEDEVAHRSFDLPYPHDGWITLFAGLDLQPGTYWLIVAKPHEKAHSSINWFVGRPRSVFAACGVRFLESKSYTFHGDAAAYIPASQFEKKFEPYGFQFELTDERMPDSAACP
jgi:hypothetical protein